MVERRGDRDAQLEEGDSRDAAGASGFNAIRTGEHTWVEYANGERELYDMRRDPHQLQNLAANADPALVRHLSAWLKALAKCAGAQCRAAENVPPR